MGRGRAHRHHRVAHSPLRPRLATGSGERRTTGSAWCIELDADFEQPPSSATSEAPFDLGPRFGFELDELHHLVWSNTVDLRDPDRPTWIGLDLAVAAGANRGLRRRAVGDVVLPDGTPIWIDAGPFRHSEPIDGVAVLHTVAIEQRSFALPGGQPVGRGPRPGSARRSHPPGWLGAHHRSRRIGKTRVLTERARHLLQQWNASDRRAVQPGGVQQAGPGGDARRTPDLPGLQVRTLNAIALAIVNGTHAVRAAGPYVAHDRRTRGPPDHRRSRVVPRKRNTDPVAPWIEALSARPARPASTRARSRQQYDGDVDGFAEVLARATAARLERRARVDFDEQI